MDTLAEYTQPIYEAVVSNLALENLRREETEKEHEKMLAQALECLTATNQVIKLFDETDFSREPKNSAVVPFVQMALFVLVTVSRHAIGSTRTQLPAITEKYRSTLGGVLTDLEVNTNRFESIAEAWFIATDPSLTSEIKQALSERTSKKKSAGSVWRETLAAMSR
jgi:hypothetical protein